MKRFSYAAALLAALIALTPLHSACAQDASQTREDARLITATQVLQELDATPDQNLPAWLMQRAYGIAVIPEVLKGAFFFGGRYGNGVMTLRNETSGRFSNPIFIRLGGGSVGWQVGATSTDVVLVFVTPRSVQNFGHGKFTLGGDASVAAGPVGRQGEAAAGINAEVYSYSRSRGLFAGVAFDGTVINVDGSANENFYNSNDVDTEMITSGKVTPHSDAARRFLAAIAESTQSEGAPAAAAVPASTTPAPPSAPGAPADSSPAAAGATRTYPLEDAHPGSEPK